MMLLKLGSNSDASNSDITEDLGETGVDSDSLPSTPQPSSDPEDDDLEPSEKSEFDNLGDSKSDDIKVNAETSCQDCIKYNDLVSLLREQSSSYIKVQKSLENEVISLRDLVSELRSELSLVNSRQEIENDRISMSVISKVTTTMSEMHNTLLIAIKNFKNAEIDNKISEEIAPYRNVLNIVFDNVGALIERLGVEIVYPNEGDEFDINKHSAVATESANGENSALVNKVVQVVSAGYILHYKGNKRLVKPAAVIVLK